MKKMSESYAVEKQVKSFIGKYVCYGEEDGSFSWGRIVNEGWVNSPKGEKEVFILEDRVTCRVPRGELEVASIQRIQSAIGLGGVRHFLPNPNQKVLLPDKCEDVSPKSQERLPARPAEPPPEAFGVPDLGEPMGWKKEELTSGVPMSEAVRTVQSSTDPNRTITFLLRRYGYRTNVRKERVNLASMRDGGDIVDKEALGLSGMTDDELFLCVMGRRAEGLPLNQGMRNLLQASSVMDGGDGSDNRLPDSIVDMAASELKERLGVGDVIEAEVVECDDEEPSRKSRKVA